MASQARGNSKAWKILIWGIKYLLFNFSVIIYCKAQFFDGFIITQQNSMIRGYMQISLDGGGRRILITDNKNKKPATYYISDLKSYAYKKDTFEIFNTFYPFEGEDYYVEGIEGKVIINKGRLKLYSALFMDYKKSWGATVTPLSGQPGFVNNKGYRVYVVKDREGHLYGIKNERSEFLKAMEIAIGDDKELMEKIKNKELKYKDMKKIISLYNVDKF